jgi:hypothetical protein
LLDSTNKTLENVIARIVDYEYFFKIGQTRGPRTQIIDDLDIEQEDIESFIKEQVKNIE